MDMLRERSSQKHSFWASSRDPGWSPQMLILGLVNPFQNDLNIQVSELFRQICPVHSMIALKNGGLGDKPLNLGKYTYFQVQHLNFREGNSFTNIEVMIL